MLGEILMVYSTGIFGFKSCPLWIIIIISLQKVNCCFKMLPQLHDCTAVDLKQGSYQNKNTIVTPVGGIVRLILVPVLKWFYYTWK